MAKAEFGWSKRADLNAGDFRNIRSIPDGPQARNSRFSRSRHGEQVAVLGGDRSMHKIVPDYLERGLLIQDAVVCVVSLEVFLGTRDKDNHLFGATEDNGEKWATVALERGQVAVGATMGLWSPDERRFYEAETVELLRPTMPVEEVSAQGNYPHTPVLTSPA